MGILRYKKRGYSISDFQCIRCGAIIPLPRLRMREYEHIKDIWCVHCKKRTKHVELRLSYFDKEKMVIDQSKKQQLIQKNIHKNEIESHEPRYEVWEIREKGKKRVRIGSNMSKKAAGWLCHEATRGVRRERRLVPRDTNE